METGESMAVVWREVLTGFLLTLAQTAHLAECYNLQTHCPSEPVMPVNTRRAAYSSVYRQLVEMICERHGDPDLSLKSLSAQLHLSERHLRRIFAELTGQPFSQCLRSLRTAKSAKLLADSNHDIKEIAALVGYRDRSHLGEDFRQVMGCTPGEFRCASRAARLHG